MIDLSSIRSITEMNLTHPGLPFYSGPKGGWFLFIHHDMPLEYSRDIAERVHYIRSWKNPSELSVRFAALQVLPVNKLPAVSEEVRQVCETAREKRDEADSTYLFAWSAYMRRFKLSQQGHTTEDEEDYGVRQAQDAEVMLTLLDAERVKIRASVLYSTLLRGDIDVRKRLGLFWLQAVAPETLWEQLYNEVTCSLIFPTSNPPKGPYDLLA